MSCSLCLSVDHLCLLTLWKRVHCLFKRGVCEGQERCLFKRGLSEGKECCLFKRGLCEGQECCLFKRGVWSGALFLQESGVRRAGALSL